MDKYDRELQRRILVELYEAAPNPSDGAVFNLLTEEYGGIDILIANMDYLEGHGLIVFRLDKHLNQTIKIRLIDTRITSKGIDFLRDDGGLGAILNVLTVRLHNDTINRLESIIGSSGAPEEEKSKLISALRRLPEDAIKHLNLKLLDLGLAHLPNAVHAIQTAIQSL